MVNILLLALTMVTVQDASAAAAPAPPPAMRVKLVNAGPRRLQAAYVSPSKESDWGANLLAAKPAEKGRAATAAGLAVAARAEVAVTGACGLYDVRIEGDKGALFLLDEVELCEDGDVFTVTDTALTHVKMRDLEQQAR